MLHTITLFEHETRSLELPAAEIPRLERLADEMVSPAPVRLSRQRGQMMIQTTQYVGVLRSGNTTIQILPKIHRDTQAEPNRNARDATANLLHMLAYADQLPLRAHQAAELASPTSDWFEILTALFASHLYDAWLRGPARSYQTIESELPVLKGRWRLSEQMRYPHRRHLFSVAYDELSANTPLNQVFRFVVERLWRLTRSPSSRRTLGELRMAMEEISLPAAVTAADAAPTLINRLSAPFLPLLNLARLFLDGEALQLAGGGMASFAFLIDMNRLFEGFIAGFLARHRSTALPFTLQGCHLATQARGMVRHLARVEGQRVFRLQPDLLFHTDHAVLLIADTKYKRLDLSRSTLGVSQEDAYQMFAYSHCYRCPQILLLYPQTAALLSPIRREFRLEGETGAIIRVATVDLRGDLGRADVRAHLAEELRGIFAEESSNE
jgi:5-methylcytosine-specific restriction enzyme subunit McrC